jgi:plasmid stability protein
MNASDDSARTFSLRLPESTIERLRRDARRHERSIGGELRALVREAHEREDAFAHGFVTRTADRTGETRG